MRSGGHPAIRWRATGGGRYRGSAFATPRIGPGAAFFRWRSSPSATFILISVDAFRRDGSSATDDPRSGVGGYQLLVESLLPIVHDPNSREGREALNLSDLDESVTIEPFRLLPGDDASCLNLYEPRNPRILAPRDSFLAEGRFAFQDSLASTEAERANPWLLLNRDFPDGPDGATPVIPVIADANSMTYVLHRRLGEDIVITRGTREIRLRLVAALRDSIFQRELLMSQAHFLTLFPEQAGVSAAARRDAGRAGRRPCAAEIEDAPERPRRRRHGHRGTARGVSQGGEHLPVHVPDAWRPRPPAWNRRPGHGCCFATCSSGGASWRCLAPWAIAARHFLLMVMAENALLLAAGLAAGAVCAGLAIAPAIAERGGRIPLTSGGALLLFAVFVTGLLSSIIATRAAIRGPLLESLRSE